MPIKTLSEGVGDAVRSAFCTGARGADWVAGLLASTPLPFDAVESQTNKFRAFACGDDVANDPLPILPPVVGEVASKILVTRNGAADLVFYLPFVPTNLSQQVGSGFLDRSVYLQGLTGDCDNLSVRFPEGNTINFGYWITGTFSGEGQSAAVYLGGAPSSSFSVTGWNDRTSECAPADPPPDNTVEPVEEVEKLVDIAYEFPEGQAQLIPDIPVRFFRPCLNLDGVKIPFELDLGFTKICGKIGARTDLTNILEPDIDIDQCPSEKEQLGPGQDEISEFFELSQPFGISEPIYSGNPISAAPRPDKPAVGLFVASRWTGSDPEDSPQTRIVDLSSVSPDFLLPDIGMIKFLNQVLLEDDQVEFAWSEPKKIRQVEQLIVNDWPHGAVDFAIQYRPGWTGDVTLLYRKTCCQKCSENDPNKGLDQLDRCRID